MKLYDVAPPLFSIYWKIGLTIPPPVFLGLWRNTWWWGIGFSLVTSFFLPIWFFLATVYSIGTKLLSPSGNYDHVPLSSFVLREFRSIWTNDVIKISLYGVPIAVLVAFGFGFCLSCYYQRKRRQLQLPSWSEYCASLIQSANDNCRTG
jgi:hypothetical protein